MAIGDQDFTKETVKEIQDPLKQKGDNLTEKDIFGLAKGILISSLVVYIVVFILFAWSKSLRIEAIPMKEIWDFSSQGLFGIVNLIIGFYFGGKIATAAKS